jgi:hypothetical protein
MPIVEPGRASARPSMASAADRPQAPMESAEPEILLASREALRDALVESHPWPLGLFRMLLGDDGRAHEESGALVA